MGGGYVNKQPKTTKFETLNNKSIYKKLALLFVAVFLVASVYFKTSSAKYKVTQEVQIVNGNIKANLADLNIMAIYVDGEKREDNQVPRGNYAIDEENTSCTVNGEEDINITFEYRAGKIGVYGVSQSKTKCDIYLNKIPSPTDAITDQVIADVQPDFSKTSCLNGTNNGSYAPTNHNCEEQTNGVYAQETKLGITYYFRGTVNNNWVKFGKINETKEVWAGYNMETRSDPSAWYSSQNECTSAQNNNKKCTQVYSSTAGEDIWWRIIRINEDGTVRLIYAGIGDNDAVASADKVNDVKGYWMSESYGINNSPYAFNISKNRNAYVGYMYGTPGSATYEQEHGYNLIDEGKQNRLISSNAKIQIDKWYVANLQDDVMTIDGVNILSGSTGFCGDRSLANGYESTGYGQVRTYYKTYDRKNNQPSYECPNEKYDLYTTKDEQGAGNGALTNPIGLITADEIKYAGIGRMGTNYGYWLYPGTTCWTLSPENFATYTYVYRFYNGLAATSDVSSVTAGLQPVVNLKPEYFKTQDEYGNTLDGTIDKPYIASAS